MTGAGRPHHVDRTDLEQDVQEVLEKLPPGLRVLAERLKSEPVAKIARDMGVARRTLRDRIAKLRAYFSEDEFREYLTNRTPPRSWNR